MHTISRKTPIPSLKSEALLALRMAVPQEPFSVAIDVYRAEGRM